MDLVTENGKLDLHRDFSMNMERTNPFFSGEGDASVPATLPSSSRNLAALGHRERIDRADRYINKVDAILQVGPVQKRGQLVIDTLHRHDGIDASFAIDSSDLYVKSKSKTLKEIFADAVYEAVNHEDFGTVAAAMTRMQAIYGGNDTYDYTIFPVAIAKYETESNGTKTEHYQYNNEDDGSHNLVYQARTVHEGDVLMSVPAGYGIAPFLKLHRLLARLFEAMGYTVVSNCFAETPFSNLTIVHNCSDCLCNPSVTLYYKDMAPSCTMSEFLEWLLAKFHAQPVVNSETKQVKIVLMEDMLGASTDIDISGKVEGEFSVQLNPTKRIVLTPTNSIEGTEPAAESFEELVARYGGFVEVDEDGYDSLEGNNPVCNDCLVLRKTTGQFYSLNYDISTNLQKRELKGTNHFIYDRKNSDETEDFSQNDVMPLMLAGVERKREVCPFIGERLHYHTSYEGKKEDDKQDIIVVQKVYNNLFANPTTGTTQKYIPYAVAQSGSNGMDLDLGLTNFMAYKYFWQAYNNLLLNNLTRLKGRVDYDLGEFLGIDMSRPKFCNGQKLIPVSAAAVLGDHFGLSDTEFLLVKSFVDGIYDTEIEPIQGNGLKWSASDNVEDVARELYANEIALPSGATQYVSYEFSLNESLSPGMPSYLNEVRTVSVQASITIHYREREIEGGQVHWTNEFEIFNNQTVTFTFTAVPA